MTPIEVLTTLQYAEPGAGPWALYIYDTHNFHSGKQWFSKTIKYADEEITVDHAKARAVKAISFGKEVRITDAGDMLVFHSRGGKILYGDNFWTGIA